VDGWGQGEHDPRQPHRAGQSEADDRVMPLGYGTMEMIRLKHPAWDNPELRQLNFDIFSKLLLTEVIPQVESPYPVSTKREDRAIAGLSMGDRKACLRG
jgi:enterochelin esterase family protein